ncbi:tetratricopeptide repeat protein [Sneathiella glossodoripedis]|uniref:tetratricopeptide repeat protein n=1 Tax=Sneathiella glossodoripedis TaxID=418853 RepID=UPI000686AFF4|nr:tetratricopeptide repeat protein [Sneathiella glossodoripedis]
MEDLYGNLVTAQNPKTIEGINRFTESLIGFGTDFGVIFEASDEDPSCALAASLAGLLGLFMETPDRLEIAERYFQRALKNAPVASTREQILIEALWASNCGDLEKAIKCHKRLAVEFPRDLLSVKIGQTLCFNLGDDEGMLWLADQVIGEHQDTAYAHGMRAFGLEQMSYLEEAEEAARHATSLKRREPWAHHAAAHVMLTQGRLDDGISWMMEHSDEWEGCNSFMYTHNWWHLALFYLEGEDFQSALKLYDERVWTRDKTYSEDQINAISLLWRLEIAGVDVGNRWQELAEFVSARTLINDQPFLDMQYAFALARGEKHEELEHLLQGMDAMQVRAPKLTRTVWRDVAYPAAQAFVAFANANYNRVVDLLGPARAHLQKVGGSHAQRDLFEQIWITSLLRAGQTQEAIGLLQARVNFRKTVPLDKSWLAAAQSTV